MLWLGLNWKMPQIPSATDDASRRRPTRGPQAEQCLKGGHGSLAPVVAENEFVKVDLQLMAPDAVVGPHEPLLQVSNRAMNGGQNRRSTRPDLLHRRHVAVACSPKTFKRFEAVGVDRRAGQGVPFGERHEGALAEVRN